MSQATKKIKKTVLFGKNNNLNPEYYGTNMMSKMSKANAPVHRYKTSLIYYPDKLFNLCNFDQTTHKNIKKSILFSKNKFTVSLAGVGDPNLISKKILATLRIK